MRYAILLLVFICCCKNTTGDISKESKDYIDEVVSIMEANSVNKNQIDWDDFRVDVLNEAKGSKTISDTYPAIQYAIKLLNDKHSYFKPVTENAEEGDTPPLLIDENMPHDIGYIRVGYCMGSDEEKELYINQLLNKIKDTDNKYIKGWIVDLRGNFGGDMTQMLLGCAPLLGDTTVGYTVHPEGDTISWKINNSKLYYNDTEDSTHIITEPYILKNANPYVAVLTDTLTASSGEAMAIAFKNRPKTKSFGYNTYGVSTSNRAFTLSDGSRMLLTVAVFADRKKNKYGNEVIPDEIIDPKIAPDRAIKWLRASY